MVSAALDRVTYDPEVIKRDRNQLEFTKTIWDYLETAVSDARIANGRKALAREQVALDRIEAQYGVDKHIVAAIWGLESAYGAFTGGKDVIRSLASLAFDARRAAFSQVPIAGIMVLYTFFGLWLLASPRGA